MKHRIDSKLLNKRVGISLVGAGGNGSQMLAGLAKIHFALLKLEHPCGFDVTVYDPDIVTEANIARQMFSPSDIGINKALVLTHRVNMFYGLNWKSLPVAFPDYSSTIEDDIVITCVDSKKSRREVHEYLKGGKASYWLDMGNNLQDGQVVLGQPRGRIIRPDDGSRLPTVTELFPVILDETVPEDNDTPSCSLEEALAKQDLFICQGVSTFALNLLWQLFRHGGIDAHGAFINLRHNMVTPLQINQSTWRRMRGEAAEELAATKAA